MSTVGDNNVQVHPNQEQEMRETSYFKQETDDEGLKSISNQQINLQKRILIQKDFGDGQSGSKPQQIRVASLNQLINVSKEQNLEQDGLKKPLPSTTKNQNGNKIPEN